MGDKVIFLDAVRGERKLKKEFSTDYELVLAFYLAKKLHAEESLEKDGELFHVDEEEYRKWFQKRLADEIERRNIRKASVYKMVPYTAQLIITYPGLSWSEWSPAKGLERHLKTDNAFELLRVAENSFFVFCFYPEERVHKTMRYRQYAFEIGTQAYRAFGHVRRNPLGADMETAFAPLGSLIREIFASHL